MSDLKQELDELICDCGRPECELVCSFKHQVRSLLADNTRLKEFCRTSVSTALALNKSVGTELIRLRTEILDSSTTERSQRND